MFKIFSESDRKNYCENEEVVVFLLENSFDKRYHHSSYILKRLEKIMLQNVCDLKHWNIFIDTII